MRYRCTRCSHEWDSATKPNAVRRCPKRCGGIGKLAPCATGKKRHKSHEQAIASALSLSKASGKPIRVYRCPVCHDLHLTSKATVYREKKPVDTAAKGG